MEVKNLKRMRDRHKCNSFKELGKEVEYILLKWTYNLCLKIYYHALPSKFHSYQVTKLPVLICCMNKAITKATKHNTVFTVLCLLNFSICLKNWHLPTYYDICILKRIFSFLFPWLSESFRHQCIHNYICINENQWVVCTGKNATT